MALVKCPECGNEVSSKAKNCPKCGFKINKGIGCGTAIGIVLLVFIWLGVISSPTFNPTKDDKFQTNIENSQSQTSITSQIKEKVPGDQWAYLQTEDKMGNGFIYQALVSSTNTVNFDFPYSGQQYATLSLRTHPRYGKDLIFKIERGQFLCTSYDGCAVLIRFDEEEPLRYSATSAADNSTETLFISNYNKFVGKMLKAKTVRISANIYKEGAPVFEFEVSNFDVKKYKPGK